MNRSEYITYWDDVVRAWLDYDVQNKNLRKETEQVLWHPILSKVLRPQHVPGPYMGDPYNASVVILNYNPGGRDDYDYMKCHQCLRCDRNYYSIINYIDRHGYSNFARSFPYLNEHIDDELKKSLDGGRKWWGKKKEWIDNLTSAYCPEGPNDEKETKARKKSKIWKRLPFAMEVCGWHSKEWPSDALNDLDCNQGLGMHLDETVVQPMIDIIKNNNTFGVCIGKKLGDMLLDFGFDNVTNCLVQFLSTKANSISSPVKVYPDFINVQFVKKNPTISIHSIGDDTDKGRNYRLLKYNDEDVYVLNTWVKGSNKHPSGSFFKLEQDIVCLIKKMLNNQIAVP